MSDETKQTFCISICSAITLCTIIISLVGYNAYYIYLDAEIEKAGIAAGYEQVKIDHTKLWKPVSKAEVEK